MKEDAKEKKKKAFIKKMKQRARKREKVQKHLEFQEAPEAPPDPESFHATQENYKEVLVREAGFKYNHTKKTPRIRNVIKKKFIKI